MKVNNTDFELRNQNNPALTNNIQAVNNQQIIHGGGNLPAVIIDINRNLPATNRMQYDNVDAAVRILNETLDLIKASDQQIDASDENIILICGDTGAGKSSLVNYLISNELVAFKPDNSNRLQVDVKPGPNTVKIGHGLVSETFIPSKVKPTNSNLVYYDCPGFSDTRGPAEEIANSFAINKLFTTAAKVQIMLVIDEAALTGPNRGQAFKELVTREHSKVGAKLFSVILG